MWRPEEKNVVFFRRISRHHLNNPLPMIFTPLHRFRCPLALCVLVFLCLTIVVLSLQPKWGNPAV